MGVYCGHCHVELNQDDKVVMDNFAILRHEECYDFKKEAHLVDTIGLYKDVRGHLPTVFLNAYKEIIAMAADETRPVHEISDDEVIGALAYTLGYIE